MSSRERASYYSDPEVAYEKMKQNEHQQYLIVEQLHRNMSKQYQQPVKNRQCDVCIMM